MIGVTADTNVYISALLFGGVPREFLLEAEAGRFRLAISQPILDELGGVLRDEFGWSPRAVAEALTHLADARRSPSPKKSST